MLYSPKLAILQSLDEMDQKQMDEVLHYIRAVLNPPAQVHDHQALKRKAMKEIRQALRREKKREVGMTA